MARHIWSVLCERISTDRETNMTSYLSALEAIRLGRLPFRMPFLAFGTLWHADNEQGEVLEFRLLMVRPDRSTKELAAGKTALPGKRLRSNIILNGLEINQSGTYAFRLELLKNEQWEQVTEIPLDVTVEVRKEETKKSPEEPAPVPTQGPKKAKRATVPKGKKKEV